MTMVDTTVSDRTGRVAREYLGKLLERHHLGASENDIRSAFRDFLIRTGIAADEIEMSPKPGPPRTAATRLTSISATPIRRVQAQRHQGRRY